MVFSELVWSYAHNSRNVFMHSDPFWVLSTMEKTMAKELEHSVEPISCQDGFKLVPFGPKKTPKNQYLAILANFHLSIPKILGVRHGFTKFPVF